MKAYLDVPLLMATVSQKHNAKTGSSEEQSLRSNHRLYRGRARDAASRRGPLICSTTFAIVRPWRWRQSPANPSLREFSLLSGKVQGISADSAEGTCTGSAFRTINQVLAAKFPKQRNRDFSRENSECPQRNRECPMSTGTLLLGRVLI
jgi:hypothetical protein